MPSAVDGISETLRTRPSMKPNSSRLTVEGAISTVMPGCIFLPSAGRM